MTYDQLIRDLKTFIPDWSKVLWKKLNYVNRLMDLEAEVAKLKKNASKEYAHHHQQTHIRFRS